MSATLRHVRSNPPTSFLHPHPKFHTLARSYHAQFTFVAESSPSLSPHCPHPPFPGPPPDQADHLCQFFPNRSNLCFVNAAERRRVFVGLSRLIKRGHGSLLSRIRLNFCPYTMADLMKLLRSRDVACTVFKLVFVGESRERVEEGCIAALVLTAANLRFFAQDIVAWMIGRIGLGRCREEVVRFMWAKHREFESDFSLLDTLMRAFLKLEMEREAMWILGWMRSVGLTPGESAMSILLKFLLRVGDHGNVWKLFRDMMKLGPRPSIFVLNAIILGFCHEGLVRISESFLLVARKFGVEPDVISYNILINARCVGGEVSRALDWMHFMIDRDCQPSTVTINTIVNGLCKDGCVQKARRIFDGMETMGLRRNNFLYNTLIDGYIKGGDISQAMTLYEEMRVIGVPPDPVTFNILFAGLSKYGKQADGDRLLCDISAPCLPTFRSLDDISVVGLCWAGRVDEAVHFLKDVTEKGGRVSTYAFNSVIAACGRIGWEDTAYEIYTFLVTNGFSPSSSTSSSMLMGLSRNGRLQEARHLLYDIMRKGFPVSKVSFTVLLDGYFKMGDLEQAQDLWSEMKSKGIYPDTIAFSAYINGLSKLGFVEEAYDVFLEMLNRGLVPNNYIYNSLIFGFCKSGRLSDALRLEKEMKQRGLLPDIFTTNIIVDGLCRNGNMESALTVFKNMHRTGLAPDIVTYNTLICGYCKEYYVDCASEFVNRMYAQGFNPDLTTYNIQIHGYCSYRKISQAVKLFDELVSLGFVPNTVTYNTLINGICKGIVETALIISAKLIKMAFVPNIVTANILLSHYCKQGMPERALFWGQKLSDISFSLDEISAKILERAYNKTRLNIYFARRESENGLFLDFLMYMTYDYLRRNRHQREHSPFHLNSLGHDVV